MTPLDQPAPIPECEHRSGEGRQGCHCHADGIKPEGQRLGVYVPYTRCQTCPIPGGAVSADRQGELVQLAPPNRGSSREAGVRKKLAARQRSAGAAPSSSRRKPPRPTCVHLGPLQTSEPCKCGSVKTIEVYECRAGKTRCVLLSRQVRKFFDPDLRVHFAERCCETCELYKTD
jgi:hypothetical protein